MGRKWTRGLACARTVRFCLTALLVIASVPVLATTARADTIVIQKSNGFPGAEGDGAAAEQKVSIKNDRLRVFVPSRGWALVIDLDKKVVNEMSAASRTYTERGFAEFDKLRVERREARKKKVEEFRRVLKKARDDGDDKKERELKRELDSEGLREDGQDFARLEGPFTEDATTRSLIIDGKRKDVRLEHYKVRENQAAKPAFDLWLVPELAGRVDLLKFWRAVGPFSNAVTGVLANLPGLPVIIEANVDTGSFSKKLTAEILEVREEAVDPDDFVVPAGFKKEDPKAAADAPPTKIKCEVCGTECDPDNLFPLNLPGLGPHYACSPSHRLELMKRLKK